MTAAVPMVAAMLVAMTSGAAAHAGQVPVQGPIAHTADGSVRGTTAGTTNEYLGIPYAAPPVGALRWRPPQLAAPWPGVREATRFAAHCPRPTSPFGAASTSEDCLHLNVFTPARRALVVGESDDYEPAALVQDGVIVVTINYRLGALGFLADAALASHQGGPSGNYGLMDQQAALGWVHRYIRAFGGDRGNATLFGESAGGLSTLAQLVSPSASGLFQRAIVESGTYNMTQRSLTAAEAAGAAFAATVGCRSNTAARLRSLPVSTIVENEDLASYTPNIDGTVLPQSIKTALADGRFSHVPVIIGTNRDEWRLFVATARLDGEPPVTAANYLAKIASTLNVSAAAATAIAAEYPLSRYSSPSVALGAVGTDAIFACPALTAEQSLAAYTPTYPYEFNDVNAPQRYLAPVGFPYGAAHESEMQYLFALSNTANPGDLSASQQQLAHAMKQDWTNFASTGVRGAGWPGSLVRATRP
jgi:para-nitrobenzyl esterase